MTVEYSPVISGSYNVASRVIYPKPHIPMLTRPLKTEGSLGEMELGFILDSWVKGAAESKMWAPRVGRGEGGVATPVPPHIPLHYHDLLLKKLLPNIRIMIACDPSDSDTIWGYAAWEPGLLHWVYVKSAFRRQGIGTVLLKSLEGMDFSKNELRVSHRTVGLLKAWPDVRFLWNPYRMMIWN